MSRSRWYVQREVYFHDKYTASGGRLRSKARLAEETALDPMFYLDDELMFFGDPAWDEPYVCDYCGSCFCVGCEPAYEPDDHLDSPMHDRDWDTYEPDDHLDSPMHDRDWDSDAEDYSDYVTRRVDETYYEIREPHKSQPFVYVLVPGVTRIHPGLLDAASHYAIPESYGHLRFVTRKEIEEEVAWRQLQNVETWIHMGMEVAEVFAGIVPSDWGGYPPEPPEPEEEKDHENNCICRACRTLDAPDRRRRPAAKGEAR